jgi:inner membrane protein
VGAAMSMFFLLLVSLSEHLPFETAYALAASSCVLLLTYYAGHMLHGFSRGIPFGAGIGVLYGMLFVLLKIEQTALLVGAVALFAVLAAIMSLTRRVDWYARLHALQAGTGPGAPL